MNIRVPKFLVPAATWLCGTLALGASDDPVDALGKLSHEWVKTRAEAARAEAEWAKQRELLASTVNALEERARELEAKRDLAKAKTAKDRGDIERLELENRKFIEDFNRLETGLKSLAERLAMLRSKLPPRLSQALELPFLTLADPDLPASERMAHTMTVLNRCVQFNRTITFGEEIVAPPGEANPKLLQTVYWGLSHGYAYDKAGRMAWLGAPGPDGWRWTASLESEPTIRALIATFDEKAEPTFVPVPAAAGPEAAPIARK